MASNPNGALELGDRMTSPRLLACGALFLGVLVLIGIDPSRIAAPFGPSHDGFNGALYMSGGRALLEDGPWASRFGAAAGMVLGDSVVYAHHPPLVYLQDAAAAAVLGPTETAGRLPAVISSLLSLLLLAFVLARCGLRFGVSAIALLFAFATPMFKMFGTTTEPHVLGLAPMTALLLLWQRSRSGVEVSRWAWAATAAIATLTSWQAALLGSIVAAAMWSVDRQRPAARATIAGVCVASMLIAAWILWAYNGDPRDFAGRALLRVGDSGSGRVTFRRMAYQQMLYLHDLFPVGSWLVVPIAACALFDTRTRALAAASLATVLGYALLFKNGAYDHDYWLYCILLPLTLGSAVIAAAVARACSRSAWLAKAPLVITVILVVLLGVTLWKPSGEEQQRRAAAQVGAQAKVLEWPQRQRYAYHMFGDRGPTDLLPWLQFYARRQPFGVDGPESVSADEVVLRMVRGRLTLVPGGKPIDP
jgi:hypothetical protein